MNLFDRVKLLIRSTLSSALRDPLPDLPDSGPNERSEKLLDKAQAYVEILQQDLARAEKRGDRELADRLRREISNLQKTLDKARKKAGQPAVAQPPTSQVANPTPSSASAVQTAKEAPESKSSSGSSPSEAMDTSRVADQIRAMRERESREQRAPGAH